MRLSILRAGLFALHLIGPPLKEYSEKLLRHDKNVSGAILYDKVIYLSSFRTGWKFF